MEEAAERFLALRRIAVTGVSRKSGESAANPVYVRLRKAGYEVFAVNPNAEEVEGDRAYPSLSAIDGGVEAVVIATAPQHAMGTVQEAERLGVRHVWMHRGAGEGSVSPEAVTWGRERGITVLDGGCPLMFGRTSDGLHRFMCRWLTRTGNVPREIETPDDQTDPRPDLDGR
ncbi:MAG: CoA-binding protein [Micrococcales bacterium]|nr:CoA-binding protein [Micrococcales bacterium]